MAAAAPAVEADSVSLKAAADVAAVAVAAPAEVALTFPNVAAVVAVAVVVAAAAAAVVAAAAAVVVAAAAAAVVVAAAAAAAAAAILGCENADVCWGSACHLTELLQIGVLSKDCPALANISSGMHATDRGLYALAFGRSQTNRL